MKCCKCGNENDVIAINDSFISCIVPPCAICIECLKKELLFKALEGKTVCRVCMVSFRRYVGVK